MADLNNPHNICGWVGKHAGESDWLADDGPGLPDLPPNFTVADFDHRPDPVKYLCCSHPRQAQAAQWAPHTFQHYLRAYRHYAGLADACFARIHAALRARPDADNTVVVVMSDHGDGLASHGMVTKQTALYEQFLNVPLVFTQPVRVPAGFREHAAGFANHHGPAAPAAGPG